MGFVPDKMQVAGPDAFAGATTTCLDARCSDRADQFRILRALVGEHSNLELVADIDKVIQQVRAFAPD